MTNKNNVTIVIPAYNEEETIASVIDDLHTHDYHRILVVNDGSYDATDQIAERAGAEVLSLLINHGQGAALRAGISYALRDSSCELIITFDADGQHMASDIQKLISVYKEAQSDIVLGSRFLKAQSSIPFLRKCIIYGGIIFTNIVSQVNLTDTHNGLRALTRKAAQRIEITQNDMAHASEIIDQIRKKKLRYIEAPVTIHYSEYSIEKGQRNTNALRIAFKVIAQKIIN